MTDTQRDELRERMLRAARDEELVDPEWVLQLLDENDRMRGRLNGYEREWRELAEALPGAGTLLRRALALSESRADVIRNTTAAFSRWDAERARLRSAVEMARDYFSDHLEVADSRGTRETLTLHRDAMDRALGAAP